MGKFQKNMAMVNNRGVDVVLNKTEEPLVKLKKRSKPLKVCQLSSPKSCHTSHMAADKALRLPDSTLGMQRQSPSCVPGCCDSLNPLSTSCRHETHL